MTSTKRARVEVTEDQKNMLNAQLEQLITQLTQKLEQYEKQNGKPYPTQLKEDVDYDYVNPEHYVQSDGRQTWEHMVDKYGAYETAVFCKLNAYKYADRIGKKPNEDVDREQAKIDWYQAKAVELFDKNERLNNDENWGYLKTD